MKKLLLLLTLLLWLPIAQANETEYQKGVDAYELRKYKTAFDIFKPLAEKEHAKAQFNLGQMYYNGQGVEQNYGEAFKWYKHAAKQGRAEGQFKLAKMYHEGKGVTEHNIYSHMWFSIAKTNGYKKTQDSINYFKSVMNSESIDKTQALTLKCWQSNYKDCPDY